MSDYKGVAWQVTTGTGVPLFFSSDDPRLRRPRNQTYRIDMHIGDFKLVLRAFWSRDGALSMVSGTHAPGHPTAETIDIGVVDDIETAKSMMYSWYLLTNKGHNNGTT